MDTTSILAWWRGARGFFIEHAASTVAQMDNDQTRLERLISRSEDVVVCVLGQAAVGKSTLLNAVVAGSETVLPAGGTGPLTAMATQVRYSAEPYFLVRYQDSRQLQGIRLALEGELRRRGAGEIFTSPETMNPEVENILAPLEYDAGGATDRGTVDPERAAHNQGVDTERQSRIEELVKQVRQIVKGDQFAKAELAELVSGLRLVLGSASPDLPALNAIDRERVERAANALAAGQGGERIRYSKAELGNGFISALREHATGSLAPLIAEIEVGWPSEALADGLVLVDLPGVGVANDRYRSVTSEFIRKHARAVVLLVDRAGPTDASVDLIRDSGYWDRLLLSSDDPESDPCVLVMAVSRVDDVAKEEHHQSQHLPKEERPKLREVFARVRAEVESKMLVQAASCFGKLSSEPSADDSVRTARAQAGAALLNSLKVFPVSATQYRDLLADDEDTPAFVREPEETGVPRLQNYLVELASTQRQALLEAREEVAHRFLRTASATLDQIEIQWTEKSRVFEEAVRLREELDRFLEPKRLELANREGAFREFLEATASIRIDELVEKAQDAARQEVKRYLSELSELRWATLKATVTRGGTFVSGIARRIDLPADLAQRFQEPMAAVWGQNLLKNVRSRTGQHGRAIEQIVQDICQWADQRSETRVQRQVLESQQTLIRDRVRQLSQVGKEAVDELKDAIKRELAEQIAAPIREQCERFVMRNNVYGAGAKQRILRLFDELSSEAVTAAAGPASKLLKARFMEVQSEILSALGEWGDPIQLAADAVVEREETRLRRADAQRRGKILGEVKTHRDEMPTPDAVMAA